MRARSLKPGIFENEILGAADPIYTILFAGLWCCADKSGRLEDRPLKIKGQVFRFRDGLDVEPLLVWLSDNGFIVRYKVKGNKYIQVLNFEKHQHPHHTEKDSTITPYSGGLTVRSRKPTGDTPSESRILTPDSGILTPESIVGDGASRPTPKAVTRGTRIPEDFRLTPERGAFATAEGKDPGRTFAKFRDHFASAPGAKGVKLDWDATWRNWCRSEYDRGSQPRQRAKTVAELEAEEAAHASR